MGPLAAPLLAQADAFAPLDRGFPTMTVALPGSAPPWFCRFACPWLCAAFGLGLQPPSPRHKISFVAFSC
jgi:hypothetical protein